MDHANGYIPQHHELAPVQQQARVFLIQLRVIQRIAMTLFALNIIAYVFGQAIREDDNDH